MIKSLIHLHCKMQSRIRKAGVRQGLGEDRLGLLPMTNPTRVTIWSLMLLCENLQSHTHEGNLPVLYVTAQHLQQHQICLVKRDKMWFNLEWPRVWAHCWVCFAMGMQGSHKEQPLFPSHEQGKCPGTGHELFLLYISAFHACFTARVCWSSLKTYKWMGKQDQTEKQH